MDDTDYDEIARRFFNQFLELKTAINSGTTRVPKNYDKEVAQYRRANEELRKAAADLAEQNIALEKEIGQLEQRESELRRQLNEATINLGLAQEKLSGLGVHRPGELRRTGYSFTEHMSEESKRAFETLMKEIPHRGTKDNE
jgi:chromosome segregation ATPase